MAVEELAVWSCGLCNLCRRWFGAAPGGHKGSPAPRPGQDQNGKAKIAKTGEGATVQEEKEKNDDDGSAPDAQKKKRYEKSMAERKHNVERLHQAETNDLRDEMEIANERREGTSMNKGSKSDFLTAMRSSGKADDKEFV